MQEFSGIQDHARDLPPPVDFEAMETTPKVVQLRLDKTKTHSEKKGDCLPDDPHYKVHFWQDGFPFDVNGELVPDNGKREPFNAFNSEGKTVTHHPLWTDKMHEKLLRKQRRINRIIAAPTPQEDEEAAELREARAADVNLEAWFRGEDYPAWAILVAANVRFKEKKRYTRLDELARDMARDHKIVREDEAGANIQPYLQAVAK